MNTKFIGAIMVFGPVAIVYALFLRSAWRRGKMRDFLVSTAQCILWMSIAACMLFGMVLWMK